jgi:hypothetical protein
MNPTTQHALPKVDWRLIDYQRRVEAGFDFGRTITDIAYTR